jgi:hypothetical protein
VLGIDAYTARARLAPTLITALPAVALLAGGLLAPGQVARLGSAAIGAVLVLASHLARDAGRRHEERLWQSWGGAPTLRRLRFRGGGHPTQVAALHARIEHVLGPPLPDADAEDADPDGADAAYNDAVRRLRNRVRGDRQHFPLVFEENVNYGFRRNLRGLKPWGLGIAPLCSPPASPRSWLPTAPRRSASVRGAGRPASRSPRRRSGCSS